MLGAAAAASPSAAPGCTGWPPLAEAVCEPSTAPVAPPTTTPARLPTGPAAMPVTAPAAAPAAAPAIAPIGCDASCFAVAPRVPSSFACGLAFSLALLVGRNNAVGLVVGTLHVELLRIGRDTQRPRHPTRSSTRHAACRLARHGSPACGRATCVPLPAAPKLAAIGLHRASGRRTPYPPRLRSVDCLAQHLTSRSRRAARAVT